MDDKDKEAFMIWGIDQDGDKPLLEGSAYEAWQAACEYKKKEYSNIMDARTRTSQNNAVLSEKLKLAIETMEVIKDFSGSGSGYGNGFGAGFGFGNGYGDGFGYG